MSERAVAVALPLPVQTPFSYAVPDGVPVPERGVRVMVPFGSRRVIGVVVGREAHPEELALKDLTEVVDESPLPTPPLLDLAGWVSDHYLAPPGECFRLVLPPAGVRASRAVARLVTPGPSGDPVLQALQAGPLPVSALIRRLGHDPSSRLSRLRRQGLVVVDQDLSAPGFRRVRVAVLGNRTVAPRGRAQAELLARLEEGGGRMPVAELVRGQPSRRGVLDRLARAGAVAFEEECPLRRPAVLPGSAAARPEPSADQARALDTLLQAVAEGGYRPHLLHGITGSGKTEIYLRMAEHVLQAGRGVLILVPEIALTPLLVRAAASRFGDTVSVLHSNLSRGERHDQWWRIREGESRVVVGARSAVFAPIPDLGLLVVDEEHEASYKQEESPRYQARDVAVMRAKLEGATLVLGSATPSVESYTNAERGKYRRLVLPARIGPQGLPRVEVVDRREVLRAGGEAVLTPPLREGLALRLARKEQSLLLLNRRGWATSLLCRECGQEAVCPHCSVALTLHQGGRTTLCHYCGHHRPAPAVCPGCRGGYLRLRGFGTEKVVEVVRAAFPTARVDRLDRDLASRRGAMERVLATFAAGETDVLVGTQMIAKGHDFPRVTLVGVVDADVALGLPDFRAAERVFQLLTQVAGRAGRADLAGEVILQTHLPDHYALRLACAQDYQAFYGREMEFRRTMGYPPSAALLNLVLHARQEEAAVRQASTLARQLREVSQGRYRVLGPARAPLARLKGQHRIQVLLKGSRSAMREAVRSALRSCYGEVSWPGVAVDVDPATVM